jgi:hypothetical protein
MVNISEHKLVNISEHKLKLAHRHSLKNRSVLVSGGECGCFHCLKTFDANEVTEWTNDGATALCPRCGIDAVLSSHVDPIDPVFLRRMHNFWFEQSAQVDLSGDRVILENSSVAE